MPGVAPIPVRALDLARRRLQKDLFPLGVELKGCAVALAIDVRLLMQSIQSVHAGFLRRCSQGGHLLCWTEAAAFLLPLGGIRKNVHVEKLLMLGLLLPL